MFHFSDFVCMHICQERGFDGVVMHLAFQNKGKKEFLGQYKQFDVSVPLLKIRFLNSVFIKDQ